MKDNIPWLLERAHAKNVAAHSKENDGKMDFEIGLSTIDSAVSNQRLNKSKPLLYFQNKEKMQEKQVSDQPEEASTQKAAEAMDTSEAPKEMEKEAQENAIEESEKEAKTVEAVQVAAATALGAAAAKAKYLAGVEERRMKGLVAQLVETQMKKVRNIPFSFSAYNQFVCSWN